MKKKVLLTSAIALATASAMTFAPVSYKVIDKASAAPAEDVVEVASKLQKIFEALNSEDVLADSYDAMLVQAKKDVDKFDLEADLPILAGAVTNPTAVEAAVVDLVKAVIDGYASDSANLGNLDPAVEGALDALNAALAGDITASINRNDVAAFLLDVEKSLLDRFANADNSLIDYVDEGQLTEEAKQAIKDAINDQWDNNESSLVAALKELYGSDQAGKDGILSDLDTAINNHKADLQANKEIYAKGAAALAVSYAKVHFAENPVLERGGSSGKKYYLTPDFGTELTIPLTFVNWESSIGEVTVDEDEYRLVLDLTGINLPRTVEVSAVIDSNKAGFPAALAAFNGVTLFTQEFRYTAGGGGFGEVSSDLSLVSDYEAKAASIADAVAAYLEKNPELYNNTLTFGLKHLVEDIVREALLVQAAGAVTVQDGASSLNVSVAQMENIYSTQLNTVLNAVKAAFEAKGIELAIDPALTYNIGVTANGQVDVSKALIDSLLSKGISAVGVKTGDAVVEIALDQLTTSSKVSVKKAASSVAGAKSDAYSISVKDSAGADLTAFEKQYRVTLPVNGTGSNVTVAQVTDGSLTLLGGQYDAESKTITFYTNQLGEFVVVENSASFNDVANIAWAKDQIQALADKGLLLGKGNGKFDPNGDVTRAEFTAMLVRAFNLNASTDLTFSDVSENAWYHDAISAAKAYGIVNGRSASIFDPNAKISREEMATMAANALKAVINYKPAADVDAILGQFVDGNQVVAVHRGNVALIKNEGIVQGKGKNNYDPKGDATRAEAAVVLAKLLDRR